MATLSILGERGIAITQCDEPHELVTPTGAALLAQFAESFGPMQQLVARRIGYGLGTRDHQTRPNVLRAVLGETSTESLPWQSDQVVVIETNLDDTSPEILGHTLQQVMEAGALDAFHTAIQMKKDRPGILFTVLCSPNDLNRFTEMILRETSAFGVRAYPVNRSKLRRESDQYQTPHGIIQIKKGYLGNDLIKSTPEFESCRSLAKNTGIPLQDIMKSNQCDSSDSGRPSDST